MHCKTNITGRNILFTILLLGTLLFMSGCTKSGKSEKELVADLQEDPFFLCNQDITITDHNIIKRQTDVQGKSDIVYINVKAENEYISWNRSYVMTYGLYNEGWILDDVAAYDESNWKVQPLQGVDDEIVQEYMDLYKRENLFDTVELVDRTTTLEEDWSEDRITFRAVTEHLYGTEILEYNQMWYFDEYSYGFVLAGYPERVDRSIILNYNIVGALWDNLARYHGSYDLFQDQFDIQVVYIYEEKIVLEITKKDVWAAHWEGLDRPPETSARIACAMLSYLNDSDEIGFSLSSLSGLLYAPNDKDDFGDTDYFIFDLDGNGAGKIERIYNSQSSNVTKKGILSGKSAEDEAIEYVVSVAKEYGMISYDPQNPICGVWAWDSDDYDFENTIWCIWPDGTLDLYVYVDNEYALDEVHMVDLSQQGEWSYDGNYFTLSTGSAGDVRPVMTVEIAWHDDDTFELVITEYSEYYYAKRVHYDLAGNNGGFSKPAQDASINDPDMSGSETIIELAKNMLPKADSFSKLDFSLPSVYENGGINYVTEVYTANNDAGYVFVIVGDGFGGKGTMKIITSMDADGRIVETQTLEHKETPGLGSKITNEDFRRQFVGVNASTFEDSVDAITGATRSSEYYFESIQSAFNAFQLITE